MMQKVKFDDVKVVKSSRKSFCLEITPSLEVILRVPRTAKAVSIKEFFNSKSKWLSEHLAVMSDRVKENMHAEKLTEDELKKLKAEAREVISERVEHYADMMGVSYKSVSIRKQKTRWGSCSAKGNLSFNCLLLLFPSELLDYVVVHELCHVKYMNHSRDFWAEVEKFMPDYNRRRALLKKCKTDMA